MEQIHVQKKDLGTQRMVMDALPYKVVGSTYDGSFTAPLLNANLFQVMMNHIVPSGRQLKIMFMRYSAAENAQFAIRETNPATLGATGAVEAFPVVGSVPTGIRDRMRVNAAQATLAQFTDRGRFEQPVHVLEGSIDFLIIGPTPLAPTANRYTFSWWGVEQPMDP